MPRVGRPFFLEPSATTEQSRREGPGVREAQARLRLAVHDRVLQAPLRRGRAEGRGARNIKFVEGSRAFGGARPSGSGEALIPPRAAVATRPFIFLSAGVSNSEVSEPLEMAGESGVSFSRCLRPGDLARRHPRLREGGRRGVPGSGSSRKASRTSTTSTSGSKPPRPGSKPTAPRRPKPSRASVLPR